MHEWALLRSGWIVKVITTAQTKSQVSKRYPMLSGGGHPHPTESCAGCVSVLEAKALETRKEPPSCHAGGFSLGAEGVESADSTAPSSATLHQLVTVRLRSPVPIGFRCRHRDLVFEQPLRLLHLRIVEGVLQAGWQFVAEPHAVGCALGSEKFLDRKRQHILADPVNQSVYHVSILPVSDATLSVLNRR